MAVLGEKVLIDNLRSDAIDIEAAVNRLLTHIKDRSTPCCSWKYPGLPIDKVDTETLLNCFVHNPQNSDESEKAHFVMTELVIDRLQALIQVTSLIIQEQLEDHKIQRCSPVAPLSSAAGILVDALAEFLPTFGIGQRPTGRSVDEECQTDEIDYKLRDPCHQCAELGSALENALKTLQKTFGTGKLTAKSSLRKIREKEELSIQEEATYAAQLNETTHINRKLHEDLEAMQSENSELEKQLDSLKAQLEVHRTTEEEQASDYAAGEKKCEQLELRAEELWKELDELQAQRRNLEQVETAAQEELHVKNARLEARKQVLELSGNAVSDQHRELKFVWENLHRQLDQLEKIYDPDWQRKLDEATQQVEQLRQQNSESTELHRVETARLANIEEKAYDLMTRRQAVENELHELEVELAMTQEALDAPKT